LYIAMQQGPRKLPKISVLASPASMTNRHQSKAPQNFVRIILVNLYELQVLRVYLNYSIHVKKNYCCEILMGKSIHSDLHKFE
jgi:hypothetical protein